MTAILPGQTRFPGKRHDFGIRAVVLAMDISHWIQGDDAFIADTLANALIVQLATGNEPTRPRRDAFAPQSREITAEGFKSKPSMRGSCLLASSPSQTRGARLPGT